MSTSSPGARPIRAVKGLDLDISAGEAVGLVGELESGKSVSALALLRLLPKRTARVTAAGILFEGKDLQALSEEALQGLRGSTDRDRSSRTPCPA